MGKGRKNGLQIVRGEGTRPRSAGSGGLQEEATLDGKLAMNWAKKRRRREKNLRDGTNL